MKFSFVPTKAKSKRNIMQENTPSERDYNTISPSAKWVLLMKGHTNIPFARQTAELIEYPEKFNPDFTKTDLGFWGRTMHFEMRYLSIDQLLSDIPIHNIIELSSGFSFRGLDFTINKDVHYIDTDLPDMIAKKKDLVDQLTPGQKEKKGKLELLPLNALDEKAFKETVQRFENGPVVIVNEGLLIYLNTEEKEKLCTIIRNVLKERGGYWITADIYKKLGQRIIDTSIDDKTKRFFEEHQVEANRFDSMEQAEAFFKKMGFVIDKEAEVDHTALSTFPYIAKNAKPEDYERFKKLGKIHTTWRLRLADES
jgi:O-methyltransferase involved in polyketide biosynthesis